MESEARTLRLHVYFEVVDFRSSLPESDVNLEAI
jgi:hypothetical protein